MHVSQLPLDTLLNIAGRVPYEQFISFLNSDTDLTSLTENRDFMTRVMREYNLPVPETMLASCNRMSRTSISGRLKSAMEYNDLYYIRNNINEGTIPELWDIINDLVSEGDLTAETIKALVDGCSMYEGATLDPIITRLYNLLWKNSNIPLEGLYYMLINSRRDLKMTYNYPQTVLPSIMVNSDLIDGVLTHWNNTWFSPGDLDALEYILGVRESVDLDPENIRDTLLQSDITRYPRVVALLDKTVPNWERTNYRAYLHGTEASTNNILFMSSRDSSFFPWLVERGVQDHKDYFVSLIQDHPELDKDGVILERLQ